MNAISKHLNFLTICVFLSFNTCPFATDLRRCYIKKADLMSLATFSGEDLGVLKVACREGGEATASLVATICAADCSPTKQQQVYVCAVRILRNLLHRLRFSPF